MNFQKLYHGSAYYPELWNEATIKKDIEAMKRCGINVVRMGEFAWATMEPDEDHIDLGFFVSTIELLYANGIESIFCTPTPTPPIWLTHNHPECLYVDKDGQRMIHGARQHVCTNNPYFRKRSRIIVEEVVKAVGELPGLIAWQTDNEFKCHVSECVCPTCKTQWSDWLSKRYRTIDALNEAWGTSVWSQRYQSFDQVPQPLATPFQHNASLSTNYRRFSHDKIVEFQDEQLAIIRRFSSAPITHNTSIGFQNDNEKLFGSLDFASFDHYPASEEYHRMLFNYDLWRTTKPGRPFWVMETSPAYNGHLKAIDQKSVHPDGFLVAEAVAAYALGAQGFSYWHWRQQRSGCELVHGSILSAWGQPTIGYKNVQAVEQARRRLEPFLLKSEPMQPALAITYSDSARAYCFTEPLDKLNYQKEIISYYETIRAIGIHRDLIFENKSLEGYKMLCSPFLPYVSESYLQRTLDWVRNGGIWILGPRTGDRTSEHTIPTMAALGELERHTGLNTVFSYPLKGEPTFGNAFGQRTALTQWGAFFEAKEARVLGTVENGPGSGLAFLAERELGQGKIVTVGATLEDEFLGALIKRYADEVQLPHRFSSSSHAVVAPRKQDEGIFWICINLSGEPGWVELPAASMDLIENQALESSTINIVPYGYRIVQ